ncbi:DUF1405 domain-containing protein [Halobacterium salinarum]|uniref:DUF1405 domain-containing protein n=1 Tax=Halobacterium TaxID=2239 RepID=UPI0019654487|nr:MULTISPECIES: DUF1405 domain-containing protein [Halobacterium]MDL0139215.1 DUF1405 domain-containing protein [Halobacterium salinarum]QRY22070.1 DUF1405 domain-containing protein [Halobacterium sp. GSL-19]WJK63452.1 DUF1405 domain-containing protein [Halobacterium salinarum]
MPTRDAAETTPDDTLPWYVAPLPTRLEDLALRLAWVIAAINVAGTVFGFWYYRIQLADTPLAAWIFVPDSPMATLFIAASLVTYKLDWDADWLHALAFFGCLKLGLWTPFVQLVVNGQGALWWGMYWFLVLSHFGMAVEAFVVHRYATFSVPAVGVALAWYGINDLLDYFLGVLGGPHHTLLRAELGAEAPHALYAHDIAAACAVALTMLATYLALATHIHATEHRR